MLFPLLAAALVKIYQGSTGLVNNLNTSIGCQLYWISRNNTPRSPTASVWIAFSKKCKLCAGFGWQGEYCWVEAPLNCETWLPLLKSQLAYRTVAPPPLLSYSCWLQCLQESHNKPERCWSIVWSFHGQQ